MSKKIAFINAKGGVGKTFLSVHVAYALANQFDKKVLLVDTDTQGHVSTWLGLELKNNTQALADFLSNSASFEEVLITTQNVDIIPSNAKTGDIETVMTGFIARESVLDRKLDDANVDERYDFVIFDTSPSISLMNQNVVVASDFYVIPSTLEPLSYAGCISTIDFVGTLKKILRLKIKFLGIIPSMVNANSKISRAMLDLYTQNFDNCFSPVKQSVKVKEASGTNGTLLFQYDNNNIVCENIISITHEIIERTNHE